MPRKADFRWAAARNDQSEAEIQRTITDYLELRRVHFIRLAVGGVPHSVGGKMRYKPNPMAGFPDIFGWQTSGRLWAMEIKKPGGRLSPRQEECLAFLSALGSLTTVVYSVGEARAWVDKYTDVLVKLPNNLQHDPRKNPWAGFSS